MLMDVSWKVPAGEFIPVGSLSSAVSYSLVAICHQVLKHLKFVGPIKIELDCLIEIFYLCICILLLDPV